MDYGLIGRHLKHSFSKLVHEKVESYNYLIKELEPEEIQSFMTRKNFKAINVTIPYKEEVIKYLDYISPEVEALGACNTIVRKDSKLYGYNTDILGLKETIINSGFDFNSKRVMILGTGGASKAAVYVSKELGAKDIILVSRTKKDGVITYDELENYYDKVDYIINATPVGMYPNNYAKPIELSNLIIGEKDGAYSEALYNHKAILYIKEQGILAMPITIYDYENYYSKVFNGVENTNIYTVTSKSTRHFLSVDFRYVLALVPA